MIPDELRYNPFYEDFLVGDSLDDFVLLPETKELLGDLGLARNGFIQFGGKKLLRFLFSDLAAGATKQRITDDRDCFKWMNVLFSENSASLQNQPDAEERLITSSFSSVDFTDIPLEAILEFRQRELNENSGHELTALRHRFAKAQNVYLDKLRLVETRASDTEELLRTLAQDMKDDVKTLMNELNHNCVDTLFTREICAIFLAVAGSIAYHLSLSFPPIPAEVYSLIGSPLAIGGIVLSGSKFFKQRRDIFAKHPMAYLYQISKRV